MDCGRKRLLADRDCMQSAPKKEEGWAVPVGSTLVSLARFSHRGQRRWCFGHLIAEECAVVLYVRVVRNSRAGVVQR